MIQEATPFLNFNGDCHKAIALYEKALGAQVEDRRPWDPAMFDGGVVPDDMKEGVMYSRLKIGAVPLEMSDMPPSMQAAPGTNLSINLHITDPAELDKCFAALAEGGTVAMPPENMFWGARYGKLIDRFGIGWSMHCQLSSNG